MYLLFNVAAVVLYMLHSGISGSEFNAAVLKVFTILEDTRETQRVCGSLIQSRPTTSLQLHHLEPHDGILTERVTL